MNKCNACELRLLDSDFPIAGKLVGFDRIMDENCIQISDSFKTVYACPGCGTLKIDIGE
jgi:hypothetical protein